ncbi:hypothetical protein RhiirA1_468022 [Rhizophagus irregularis]|uniref:Serine-threonine/tyrosine-protein kinase catalytic domain-containing protein n=1 Tax=Rhizophagus irregularis TaxID=588596 RepID=A0A2N0RAV8_9GLOM|nr:hypothetical protein RhiirA1_468022 [Rhizophagus irregularis]
MTSEFQELEITSSSALAICNGLRPEFGKGTPKFYKKLAYKCMDANPNERPTTKELRNIFDFWDVSIGGSSYGKVEKFGYKRKEIKAAFEEADKKYQTSQLLSNSIQLRSTIDIDDETLKNSNKDTKIHKNH